MNPIGTQIRPLTGTQISGVTQTPSIYPEVEFKPFYRFQYQHHNENTLCFRWIEGQAYQLSYILDILYRQAWKLGRETILPTCLLWNWKKFSSLSAPPLRSSLVESDRRVYSTRLPILVLTSLPSSFTSWSSSPNRQLSRLVKQVNHITSNPMTGFLERDTLTRRMKS